MVTRFMAWKLATSFVLTTKTWLGAELIQASDEALFTIGISQHERLAVLQRMKRDGAVSFSQPMWLAAHHIDGCYLKMLPGKRAEATAEEAAALERVFGKNGELPAERFGSAQRVRSVSPRSPHLRRTDQRRLIRQAQW